MAEIAAKVLIVGGGPGGYVCAIRAGQLGLDVVLVEHGGPDGGLGGTCLNVGCIPSKAIIHAADAFHRAVEHAKSAPFGISVERPSVDFGRTIDWKDGIVGRLTSGVAALLKRHRVKIVQGHAVMVDGKTCRVETDTGPQVVRAEHVVLATGSMPAALPTLLFGGRVISSTEALSLAAIPGRLAVVGAGYIGLELGTAFAKLGAKVTVIEAEPRILPVYDGELARPVGRRLQALGVEVTTGARAVGLSEGGGALVVAELIAGHRRVFDGGAIPAVCFTDPEIVTVGLSPEEARKAGHEVHIGLFPFQANGRALTLAEEDGLVRVTARADNHLILGIAAVGTAVSELAGAFGLALEMGARLEDIGGTIHAHPTLGEAFHEASLRALGEALHI